MPKDQRASPDFLPNGFALLPDRSFMIANLGPSGGVWRMLPDGELVPELLEVDGMTLPPTNFANAEHTTGALRLWVSVSTRTVPREQAMRSDVADGYIVLKDAARHAHRRRRPGLHQREQARPVGTVALRQRDHGAKAQPLCRAGRRPRAARDRGRVR